VSQLSKCHVAVLKVGKVKATTFKLCSVELAVPEETSSEINVYKPRPTEVTSLEIAKIEEAILNSSLSEANLREMRI
jgi:hypothetical protein